VRTCFAQRKNDKGRAGTTCITSGRRVFMLQAFPLNVEIAACLELGYISANQRIYNNNISKDELLVLQKALNEYSRKGYIRPSTLEAGSLVLFVKKPGSGLRFCCDFRVLNTVTKKNRYPLPLVPETIRNLTGADWITKVDIVAAFYYVRIALGHKYKTAF
jgi:hypothetical protein